MPQVAAAVGTDGLGAVHAKRVVITELDGISPRTLSQRLDDLAENGIISRQSFAEVPPRCEYTLTDKGRDLIPILEQMALWGEKYYNK